MTKEINQTIWHPFTQMKTAAPPIHIERAKDCTLYDEDGKEYIDAISSWWVNIHGHCNSTIAEAISDQVKKLEQVIFAGFTHTPAKDLANSLIDILPATFSKVFYSDNGSTSVEVALKMALQFWHNQDIYQKTKIIAFENAYHGDTFGAMSVGAKNAFNAAFSKHMFHVEFLKVPNSENIDQVTKEFQELIEQNDVAAFIFEPLIQGSNGMLMHEPEYLDQLISIAQQKNVICIADEVMTGFGRTGRNFAINYLENTPEIICLSKGITGGFMPLGVTVCAQYIYNAFFSDERSKTFFHGHSYTANPLACAAANASLKLLLDKSCQAQIKEVEKSHLAFINQIKNLSNIKEIRHRGTIVAIEVDTTEGSSYFNTIGKDIYNFCLNEGVLIRPLGNVIYIMPPYCINKLELEKVYSVLIICLNQLKKEK